MKKIIFILLLSAISFQVSAQDTIKKSLHQLGINVGSVTGLGLSYRYTPGKVMHQVTFLPIANDNFFLIDLAYSFHYKVKERSFADFDLYCGTHFMLLDDAGLVNITGGGFGFDFKCSDHFNINLNAGYGAYFLGANADSPFSLYPTGELGLFYKL